ncbi:MAG: hypothetical protein TR69_WS6001000779 [candidate division WS6 bacterium OLB20]|uniref:Septum formation initiator n=1 Tax=candidate division WS6 bacterium OLB20 TaxID=1617426 RepID=A0A136LYN0_9BACT|nr:MAG: hypothetical protein TR69_WS6001000779 [candidate division WS6 bacterium OLB20]
MRITKLLKRVSAYIRRRFTTVELTYGDIVSRLVMVVIIVALSINIYTAFNKGRDNLTRIEEEEARLTKLEEEQSELEELVKYYESVEYRRSYARESWNLAEPGEKLYVVQRDNELPIEFVRDNNDPIILRDNVFWWQKLILGG